jgi:hypothetical protein
MARPRLFDEPLTPAERARRYRRRRRLAPGDVQPVTYRTPVTETAWPVTKPRQIDIGTLIA